MADAPADPAQHSPLPVACALGPQDGLVRLRRWQRLGQRAAPVAHLLGGRLEVRYLAGEGVHEELTELAAAEQRCCSFVHWSVSVVKGRPVLQVTAPTQTPEAVLPIAALFGAAPETPPSHRS